MGVNRNALLCARLPLLLRAASGLLLTPAVVAALAVSLIAALAVALVGALAVSLVVTGVAARLPAASAFSLRGDHSEIGVSPAGDLLRPAVRIGCRCVETQPMRSGSDIGGKDDGPRDFSRRGNFLMQNGLSRKAAVPVGRTVVKLDVNGCARRETGRREGNLLPRLGRLRGHGRSGSRGVARKGMGACIDQHGEHETHEDRKRGFQAFARSNHDYSSLSLALAPRGDKGGCDDRHGNDCSA